MAEIILNKEHQEDLAEELAVKDLMYPEAEMPEVILPLKETMVELELDLEQVENLELAEALAQLAEMAEALEVQVIPQP